MKPYNRITLPTGKTYELDKKYSCISHWVGLWVMLGALDVYIEFCLSPNNIQGIRKWKRIK